MDQCQKAFETLKDVLMKSPILSKLFDLEFTEPNSPGKEGCMYGYAIFEQLPDIYVDSIKCEPTLTCSCIKHQVTIMKKENSKCNGVQLSLSTI